MKFGDRISFFVCFFFIDPASSSSMATTASAPTLPTLHPMNLRLDRTNYAFWRIQVLTTIRAHGFDDFISSTADPPPQLTPANQATPRAPPRANPDYHLWLRRDQFLMSWMLASIHESMLGHVVRCTSATQIWNVLEQLFQSQSRARILQLKKQLHSQKKGALTVDEYFLKMRSVADQLSVVGHIIPEDELGDSILNGFGPEYESVVVNLMHRSVAPSLQEMQYALQSHEIRLQQSYSISDSPMAHYVYRGGRSGSSRGRGFIGRGGSARSAGKPLIVCQLSGRPNHVALKCYKRFDVHFTGAESTAPQAYLSDFQSSGDYEFDEKEGVWYVDSGTTNHITNSVNNMQLNTPYTGSETLTVGNGQEQSSSAVEGETAQGLISA